MALSVTPPVISLKSALAPPAIEPLSEGSPTGIVGTPAKEQDWTLDPVGNWSAFVTRTAGTTDLNQTRTSNQVNEITAIGGTPGWATPPTYDAAGNMTSFPQPATPANAFGATYDAWNRLTKVTDGANTVAEYVYDGFGRRIVKKTYTGGTLTETRHVYYTAQWQNIEERIGTSTTADRQQVWGIRYVDELVCRDDPTPQRLYACQDANFNLTAIVDATGAVVERSSYTPYGIISYLAPNWSSRAVSSYGWVVGFQGLLYDPETGNWYQRARYSNPLLGRFMQRDQIKYVDGVNFYEYVRSNPAVNTDWTGNKSRISVDKENCAVTITVNITVYGSGANVPAVAESIKRSSEREWNVNRKVDGCLVQVVVHVQHQPKPKGKRPDNQIWLTDDPNHRSWVSWWGNSGVWGTSEPEWVYAHEVGHLMGLPDDYTDAGGPNPGHAGHMMAEYGGMVNDHELQKAIRGKCPCECKEK